MVARVWRGWTTSEKAAEYERLLNEQIFPGIAAKAVDGYRGIQLLRRQLTDEVEFKTIMLFDSIESVRQFAGEDYEQAYVPPAARAVLARFDVRSEHYEVRTQLSY
jgi:hypothetical protein